LRHIALDTDSCLYIISGIVIDMGVWEQFLAKVAGGVVTNSSEWLLSRGVDGLNETFFWRNPTHELTIEYAVAGNGIACRSLLESDTVPVEILAKIRDSTFMDTSMMGALHPGSSLDDLAHTLLKWNTKDPSGFKGRLTYYLSKDFDQFQRFKDANLDIRSFFFEYANIEALTSFILIIGEELEVSISEENLLAARVRSFTPSGDNFIPFLRAFCRYITPKSLSLKNALAAYLYNAPGIGEMLLWWLNPVSVIKFTVVDLKLYQAITSSLSRFSNDQSILQADFTLPIHLIRNPNLLPEQRVRLLTNCSDLELVRGAIATVGSFYLKLNDSFFEKEAIVLVQSILALENLPKRRIKTGYLLRSFIDECSERHSSLLKVLPPEYHFLLASAKNSTLINLLNLPAQSALLRYENPGELLGYLLKELDPSEVEIFAALVDEFDGTFESLLYVAKTCSSQGLVKRRLSSPV